MVSIGSLRYDIVADTQQFKKGIVATKRELTAAKRVIMDTRTPTEKLGIEVEGLNRLFEKGAIDAKTHARAVDNLKNKFGAVEKQTTRTAAAMNRLKTAIGGIASVETLRRTGGFLKEIISEQLDEIDVIAKTARKIGATTDDLITLRLAAEEFSGITETQLDDNLQKMTRRLAEAAAGTEKLQHEMEMMGASADEISEAMESVGMTEEALHELGLDARELVRIGPGPAFAEIAEAMQDVDNQADRLRLSFALFGRQGADMVNILGGGKEGLAQMRAEAERLGILIDDDLAASVENTNDSITEMEKRWVGLKRTLTLEVAPALMNITELLNTASATPAFQGAWKAAVRTYSMGYKFDPKTGKPSPNVPTPAAITGGGGNRPTDREVFFGNPFKQEAPTMTTSMWDDAFTDLAKHQAANDPFSDIFKPKGGALAWLGLGGGKGSAAKSGPIKVAVTELPPAATRASREEYQLVARINSERERREAARHQAAQGTRQQQVAAVQQMAASIQNLVGGWVGI